MLINPYTLGEDPQTLEDIEKASLRLVVQALFDYHKLAVDIFRDETDLPADIAEDVTREALDRMGLSRIDQRLLGKIDYKRARYVFHPEYAVRQALFVDSKAEKGEISSITLQTSQISMRIRLVRAGRRLDEVGQLAPIINIRDDAFLSTTIFVKYNYHESLGKKNLRSIIVAAVPNGMLQEKYNPDALDTIWRVGRDAPTLGEEFRVRLALPNLRRKTPWRVQEIAVPTEELIWRDPAPATH